VVVKEISARYASAYAAARNRDKVDGVKDKLAHVIKYLSLLCLSRDAASPQVGLLTIYFSSQEADERLESACKALESWAQHWEGAPGLQEFARLREVICGGEGEAPQEPGMQARLQEVERVALEAATTCDSEEVRKSCDAICKELTALHDDYNEVVCLLQRLKCSPEMEPTFLEQVSRYLDRAIYYVALAFQAVPTVCVTDKTWTEQLAEAWDDLGKQVPQLAQEVARAARKNLCGPAELCRDQLTWLSRYAEQGANAARQLQSDPGSAEALARSTELLGKFQGQLLEFNGKKLPRRALDGFSRPLAQISRILSGCPEEEDCCLLTGSQLEQLLERLQPALAGIGCEHLAARLMSRARSPIPGRRPGPSPVSASAPQHTLLPADDGLRQLRLFLELLPGFGDVASRLVDYVPEALKPPLRDIASRAPQQQSRLRAEEKAGTLARSPLAPRLGLQLYESLRVLTAAYTVAQDTAPAAARPALGEVGRQLNLLTQRLTGGASPQQPAVREPACCTGGGKAS
jgi:hypothetical protein